MMKKKTTTKKRNPQDTTLRNINALKKRFDALEDRVYTVESVLMAVMRGTLHPKIAKKPVRKK